MTRSLVFAFLSIMVVAALGASTEEEDQFEALPLDSELATLFTDSDPMLRESRVSCLFGNAVCNGHCKLKGFKSGYCSKGTCYCRK